jgi:peptidoglycan/LPS O-acetylase OafA/YrhL
MSFMHRISIRARAPAYEAGFNSFLSAGYRPDIDGLRAIAVLSVIAYHFNIGPVPGGFTGVDIFFVISGFLITSNIRNKLDANAFSFLDFYQRRVRRIFPALLLVLLAYFVAALLTFSSDDKFSVTETTFDKICWAIGAGAGFVTNFTQLQAANYFSAATTFSPLLHLWSLAIEEQFYIVWPLILFSISSIRVKYFPIVLTIGVASFAFNVVTMHFDQTIAFYSPLSRAWELMAGATLACPPLNSIDRLPISRNARSTTGMALILVGLFVVNYKTPFPGWWALFPTMGAFLLISAGPDAFVNKRILGTNFLVWIGLISYPLYLWHWPAQLLFQKYVGMLGLGVIERPFLKVIAIAGAIAASYVTFRFVEIPIRFGAGRPTLRAAMVTLAIAVTGISAVAAPSLALSFATLTPYQRETIDLLRQARNPEDVADMYGHSPCLKTLTSETAAIFLERGCVTPKNPSAKTVFLMGDSHSGSLSVGLRPLMQNAGLNFLQVSTGSCEPTNNNPDDKTCSGINEMVSDKIAELRPDLVIFDAFWLTASRPPWFLGGGNFLDHLIAKIRDIEQRGARKIVVVGQIPVWPPSLPDVLVRNLVRNDEAIPTRTFVGVDPESLEMDSKMKMLAYPPTATYFSVKDILCDAAGCLTKLGPDLRTSLIVWDGAHLTPAGSEFLARKLTENKLSEFVERK